MISYEQAHQKALERVAQIAAQSTFEIVILKSHIRETESAWYFPYNGRDYVENGNFSAALAGNHPVRVAKVDARVTLESPPDHDEPNKSAPRTVGYGFATAAGLTVGLQAGTLFAVNEFYPRSLTALTVDVVSLLITLFLVIAGWRVRSWLADVVLGIGVGGLAATVVVGLATAGGAS